MAVVVSGTFSPSPSARACSDLKADVARYVGAPNAARALATAETCIGTAVARLNTRAWPWMLVYQDITLVADTIDYDLAAPFAFPRHAYMLDTNQAILGSIGFKDMKSFSVENADTRSSGTPSCYTVYNAHEYGTMSFDVAPSSGFVSQYPTIRLWYYRKVQPCGGSTTALDVPYEVGEWVSWHAKALIAGYFDPQKVGMARTEAAQLWSDLLRQAANVDITDWS